MSYRSHTQRRTSYLGRFIALALLCAMTACQPIHPAAPTAATKAQSAPVWTSYARSEPVVEVAVQMPYVWTATPAGVVRWNTEDGMYEKFTTGNGLAGNDVRTVTRHTDGSLWFGMWGSGVSRLGLDGTWTTYTRENGLAGNNVEAIVSTAEGSLWFATWGNGVSRLDPDGTWTTYTEADGLARNYVHALVAATDGSIWFGTERGAISRLVPDGTWTSYSEHVDGAQTIVEGTDGSLWFGFGWTRTGISRLAPDGTWTEHLPELKVFAAGRGADGSIWVSGRNLDTRAWELHRRTPDGLWSIAPAIQGLTDNVVLAITSAADGSVWFGGYGLSRLLPDGMQALYREEEGPPDYSVSAIVESTDGSLWFGGTDNSVHRLGTDGTWRRYTMQDGMVTCPVRTILAATDGSIWFGGGTNNFNFPSCAEDSQASVSRLLPDGTWAAYTLTDTVDFGNGRFDVVGDYVEGMIEATDGSIWFVGVGASRLLPDGTWITYSVADGLAYPLVASVLQAADGSIWFGTGTTTVDINPLGGGVSRLAPDGTWTTYTQEDGLDSNYVHTMAEAADGSLWFGFGGSGGATRLTPDGTWETYPPFEVTAIDATEDGQVWFGTWNNGVSRLDPDGTGTTYTEAAGLLSNRVWSVFTASNGALWVGTDVGVCRYGVPTE